MTALSFPFSVDMQVRGPDIDSWGHVNNAVYLEWLEHARWEMARIGRLFDRFGGALPFVRHVELDFLKETLYGDRIRVTLVPGACGNTSFTMQATVQIIEALQSSRIGATALEAKMAFTMVKPGVGKQPVPEFWRALFVPSASDEAD